MSAPRRGPTRDADALIRWYYGLTVEDQRMVAEVARDAAHAGIFGVLCVVDGVRVIDDPPHVELVLTTKSSAVPRGESLHPEATYASVASSGCTSRLKRLDEARPATRTVYLTDAEFTQLHDQDRDDPPPADYDLDITNLTIEEQVAAVIALWRNTS